MQQLWNKIFTENQNHVTAELSIIPLPDYSLIALEGPDTQKFLQGQCTCDFNELANNNWLLGAHCNAKGRMHSSFHAAINNEQTLLRIHSSIEEHALTSLKKYAVFSKVSLEIENRYAIFAVKGSQSRLAAFAKQHLECNEAELLPGHAFSFHTGKALILSENLIEIWCDKEKLPTLLEEIKTDCKILEVTEATQTWERFLISKGRAEVRSYSIEQFIPQEMNFQLIEGISFKKGCYTGQEVIARMHYRAQLKKHMYRIRLVGKIDEQPLVSNILSQEGKNIGKTILSAKINDAEYEALALLNDNAVKDEVVVINGNYSAELQILELPYAIPK